MAELLLTVEQAAERLQMHPESVRRWLRRGELRGIKRGSRFRIPESALAEKSPHAPQAQAETIWQKMTSGDPASHNAALRELFDSPAEVQQIVMARSADVAARYYATPEGQAEVADWNVLDAEPVHDEAGDYYGADELEQIRAMRAPGETADAQ